MNDQSDDDNGFYANDDQASLHKSIASPSGPFTRKKTEGLVTPKATPKIEVIASSTMTQKESLELRSLETVLRQIQSTVYTNKMSPETKMVFIETVSKINDWKGIPLSNETLSLLIMGLRRVVQA